ncbi:DExH-box splicing factor binding site-domain-containing protein [Chaetomium sp. MPI-CAGE-AT-0009]|nr:DExH-box splicing factor binding site-domain-containing protein [Chaetomium sp. MPI-CAGE-AT-0009]
MPDHEDKTPRIVIPLGKSTSSPHSIKKRARPAHEKRHRAHALHENSESEDNSDHEQQTYGRQETITSYNLLGTGLDDGDSQKRNGSSRHDASAERKQDEGSEANKPEDANSKAHRNDAGADDSESRDKPTKWGLTINMKGKGDSKNAGGRKTKAQTETHDSDDDSKRGGGVPKTVDEEALDALMGSRVPKRKHLDSDAADREPRPEDYRSVPIDDFGAHLLRNFGWDGKMKGKVKEVTRHANLTGLGAKDAKGAEDLGSWNQKTTKDSRPVRLDDYRREESKKRQRTDDRYADSYKRERERERERERGRGRDR